MMTKTKRALATIAAVLMLAPLAACSATDSAQETAVEEVPVEAAVEYATEAQVASVIAEYEQGWRETIAEKLDCGSIWRRAAQDPADLEANMSSLNCMSSVHNMATSTGTAIIKLDKLSIPPSMEELVETTRAHLSKVSESGVQENCDLGGDAAEPECEMPMLAFETSSMQLESDLNAWGPYL